MSPIDLVASEEVTKLERDARVRTQAMVKIVKLQQYVANELALTTFSDSLRRELSFHAMAMQGCDWQKHIDFVTGSLLGLEGDIREYFDEGKSENDYII